MDEFFEAKSLLIKVQNIVKKKWEDSEKTDMDNHKQKYGDKADSIEAVFSDRTEVLSEVLGDVSSALGQLSDL